MPIYLCKVVLGTVKLQDNTKYNQNLSQLVEWVIWHFLEIYVAEASG